MAKPKDREKEAKEAEGRVAVSEGSADREENLWDDDQVEGQLAVDVYQTPDAVVVESTIAGVEAGDLDIALHEDVLTIRGRRRRPVDVPDRDYLFQECYWGGFSRSVILPVDVEQDGVKASLRNGILTVVLPKSRTEAVKVVPVREG
jgi:HSP20 family protein